MLVMFMVVPLFCAFLITLAGRRSKNLSEYTAQGAAAMLAVGAILLMRSVLATGTIVNAVGGWRPPLGICMVADGFSAFMLVIVNCVSLVVIISASDSMRWYTEKWKFYTLLMLLIAGMNGVIMSGDLFTLYVFLELASVAGYILVAFGTEAESLEAAFRYAIMGSLASILILLGIALLYSYASTLNMADAATVLTAHPKGILVGFVSVLFLAGFGFKCGLVPFHAWLPDAYTTAPAPVSAIFAGTLSKTLGVYALCRIFFNVIGICPRTLHIFMALGLLSMVVGALLALVQDDTKRMFAYSSISQIGLVVFALGIGTPLAVFAALFHLGNHASFKALLFLNAGALEQAAGYRDMKKAGGLGAQLPVTGVTGLFASMSLAGVPPFAGFWSKLLIIIAAIQARQYIPALIAVLASVLTLAYCLKFLTRTFFSSANKPQRALREAPWSTRIAMVALATVCAVGMLALTPAFKPYVRCAADALMAGTGYKDAILMVIKT